MGAPSRCEAKTIYCMKLILMRHLDTEFCGADRFCGRTDCGLLEGAQVALDEELTGLLGTGPLEIISSPMRRCICTADQLKALFPAASVRVCEALIERDYGACNGAKKEDVQALIELGQEADFRNDPALRPCGGESRNDVKVRVHRFMDSLEPENDRILVITHQGVLREIYSWLGISDYQKFQPGEIRVEVVAYANKRTACPSGAL